MNPLHPCLFVFVVMRDIIHYCYKGFKKSLCVGGMNMRNVHINKVSLQYNHSLPRGCPTPVFDDDYHALSCSQI